MLEKLSPVTELRLLTDEHPLRKLVSLEILEEHGGVLDLSRTSGVSDDGVVENLWVVLSDIVVGTGLLIDPSEPFKPTVWQIFLI